MEQTNFLEEASANGLVIGAIVRQISRPDRIGQVVSFNHMASLMFAVEFFDGNPEGIFKPEELQVIDMGE